jgi:serine/threonine protein kinase
VPFRKELDILDQILNIHHPHLIQHICSFVVGDGHFVVFPWAGGGNLRQYWEKEDRTDRTADLLVWHLQQLLGEADALRALHEINCRHGDLKPENILYFDDEKNFVVADVGLSHIHMDANMHRSLTTSSQATTPSYEAPDVITGIDSPQSRLYDIWSLGCIFLEFMVWFLFDHDSIKFFRGSRLPSNTPGKGVIWSYFYYIQENGEVIVHPVVSEVTAALRSDPRCTGDTALGAVLDLISEALLRVEVKERHAAGQVVDILRMIYERAKSEPSYCFNAVEVDPIKPTWLHAKTENLVEVASTIETSRDGYQASSTGRTYSTQPTTLANSRSSKPPLDKVMIAQNSIIEEWELTTDEPAPVPQDMGDVGDGQSTISGDSVLLNPGCRDFIIKEFSAALLRELPSKHLLLHSRFLEDPAFRQSFSAFLKIYTKAVMEGTAKHSRRRQASKAIRQLRDSILPRLQKVVSDSRDPEMPGKIPTTITRQVKNAGLEEQSWKEKCSEWQIDCNDDRIHLNETQLPRSDGPESDDSISSNEQDECEEDNPDNKDAYLYLTQHSAFSTLTRDVQKAMEQHFGNAMELIRHRVMLALRRPETIEKVTDGAFRASLRTEWDPGAFLKDQYPAVRMQPIRHTLALTGEGVDAQLTSVENYLGQVWPKHTYRLVDTINSTLVQNEGDTLCKLG